MRLSLFSSLLVFSGLAAAQFDFWTNTNVVVYWGQEGGTLASVCESPAVDVVVLAFLNVFFGPGGQPEINFASSCNGPDFPGTSLLECTQIGDDIETCQSLGKIVMLSLGGSVGTYGFSSAAQAESFATTLWDMFAEGWGSIRPFGWSLVDGFDLDIENGVNPQYYADFVNAMRSYTWYYGSKYYYISAAPQCPYPDASLGDALESTDFDMVFVQFYNNPSCNVGTSGFNYQTWQWWADYTSTDDWVKIYVGVPASSEAAGSGYVSPAEIYTVVADVQWQTNFGGIMMWDANQAFANVLNGVDYAQNAKNALLGIAAPTPTPTPTPTTSTSTKHTTTTTAKKGHGKRHHHGHGHGFFGI